MGAQSMVLLLKYSKYLISMILSVQLTGEPLTDIGFVTFGHILYLEPVGRIIPWHPLPIYRPIRLLYVAFRHMACWMLRYHQCGILMLVGPDRYPQTAPYTWQTWL